MHEQEVRKLKPAASAQSAIQARVPISIHGEVNRSRGAFLGLELLTENEARHAGRT